MQPEVDLITELWSRLKPFIPAKERLDVADVLVEVFDEHGMADGLEDQVDTLDKTLAAAVTSLYGLDADELEEENDGIY